ncbi:melatonin receptor type 1B-B [Nematostella vectensis]|uniref:melatonin receptor type 1B-B n=1 Tax=Nematostella vectensis TaxID=45351 RepID=UPI002077032E|nr:melatonin receptor type 1B-B [Nematostella vectensis]
MNKTKELYSGEIESRTKGEVVLETLATSVICIMGSLGNFVTLLIIYKNPRLRTPTNLLIASLAFSDFSLATFLGIPLYIATVASFRFPFPASVCQFEGFAIIVMIVASIQTVAWTAVNRFYRVVRPTNYSRIFTIQRTSAIVVFVWTLSLLTPIPYLCTGELFVFNPGKGICFVKPDLDPMSTTIVFIVTGFPITVTLYCYFRVFLKVRQHNSQVSQSAVSADEIRVTKLLFVIVFVFMSCWTPIVAVEVIDYYHARWVLPRWVYIAYSFLGLISSAVNPLIYVTLNKQFRGEYLTVLRPCFRKMNVVSVL